MRNSETLTLMKFQFNDGGRKAAGFEGSAYDCVCRAVAIASGEPYMTIYERLSQVNENTRIRHPSTGKRSARNGIFVQSIGFKRLMVALGFVWTPTMGIGTGCKVHLADGELPMGRLVVNVSKHTVAGIDGVVQDTHDPTRGGKRCVYGYWSKQSPVGSTCGSVRRPASGEGQPEPDDNLNTTETK